MNNESVGKKIVEALKKQAENMDMPQSQDMKLFSEPEISPAADEPLSMDKDIAAVSESTINFFDEPETEKSSMFADTTAAPAMDNPLDSFEMPANIAVLKKLISQLPSGVSRHTGAQIIKQTMEALGISMKSVLQDAQQVQENLKVSARDCQGTIQEYKKQILTLEKQSQSYQRQYSALNDLISLFIQTTK